MEYKVVLHEKYEELKKKSEQYMDKLSGLIEEYSYTISHEYNKILTEYIMKVGALEYEEFKTYTEVETLKRKIQLITIFLNRGEEPNISAIEGQIRKEFREYYTKLQSMEEDLEVAKILKNAGCLSAEDSKELKALYKNLVKKLHPDVNYNSIENAEALWLGALEAYQNGELEILRTLTNRIDNSEKDSIDIEIENAFEIIRGKYDRLKERTEKYILKIAEIENTFPFDKVDFLKNESQVKERQQELKESIAEWNKLHQELEKKLNGINVF